jgi:hypothetical protein
MRRAELEEPREHVPPEESGPRAQQGGSGFVQTQQLITSVASNQLLSQQPPFRLLFSPPSDVLRYRDTPQGELQLNVACLTESGLKRPPKQRALRAGPCVDAQENY